MVKHSRSPYFFIDNKITFGLMVLLISNNETFSPRGISVQPTFLVQRTIRPSGSFGVDPITRTREQKGGDREREKERESGYRAEKSFALSCDFLLGKCRDINGENTFIFGRMLVLEI